MKKSIIFFLFLSIIFSAAADTKVTYIEGTFEVKEGNTWVVLSPGDTVKDGSILRTGDDTVVELSVKNHTYSLTRKGIYLIDYITKDSSYKTHSQSFIMRTIHNLFHNNGSQASASLGVRGAETRQEEISWSNDEFAEYLQAGKDALAANDFSKAKENFSEALDSAFEDSEVEEADFYLAYSEALTGDVSRALEYIKDAAPDENTDHFNEAVLLKTNLLLLNNKPEEALAFIETEIADAPAITDSLLFLKGIAHLRLGELDEARTLFRKVETDYPDSDSAAAAAEY